MAGVEGGVIDGNTRNGLHIDGYCTEVCSGAVRESAVDDGEMGCSTNLGIFCHVCASTIKLGRAVREGSVSDGDIIKTLNVECTSTGCVS